MTPPRPPVPGRRWHRACRCGATLVHLPELDAWVALAPRCADPDCPCSATAVRAERRPAVRSPETR